MESLKDLELSRSPLRLSGLPILSEIAGLKELKKLSVCHFDIRYLPPEIECLTNLEYLNLSFNKIRNLPMEITKLSSLLFLDVSSNKLVELPSGMCSLERLEELDVSNNRLTSLGYLELELESMCNLKRLNLQGNRIRNAASCKIPPLICCNLEGNLEGDDPSCCSSSGLDVVVPPSPRLEKKSKPKGWKRLLQQRLERSNRKRKVQNNTVDFQNSVLSVLENDGSESTLKKQKNVDAVDDDEPQKNVDDDEPQKNVDDDETLKKENVTVIGDDEARKKNVDDEEALTKENVDVVLDDDEDDSEVELERCCVVLQTKRQCDSEPDDNPKARKSCRRRQLGSETDISHKYRRISYCCVDDYLPDGFYDAGRNRPFMSLTDYEDKIPYDSGREVILMDREKDENLDAIVLRAKALVSSSSMNESEIASFLAFFVSDHFGGSDKSGAILKMRKDVSGSNYEKPFVCTCATGNAQTSIAKEEGMDVHIPIIELCDRAIGFTKERRNSIVVPIGSLQFGVCRHRAILMKYLCDRMEPPMQCELVRGFLDFTPHAWNVIVMKKAGVRMIVDACHPQDIRKESDTEYFSRYIPLTRMLIESDDPVSVSEVIISETANTTVLECEIGSVSAAAKVRTLKLSETTCADDIAKFELSCLGEARMLSLVRHHPCIVKYYGHQMSSNVGILQSTLFMEYIQGGSLNSYLKGLEKTGEKRVPAPLTMLIARDVASALAELHDRDIIHRDIKSGNILLDLNEEKDGSDGSPLAKLSDFDRAIPLRASLHSCCIAHTGVHPPNVCVGTPHWMAPEVYRARVEHIAYGVEADIWSFGCLLFEMLTLKIPYSDLTESVIGEHLERGKRPQLTEELQGYADSPIDYEAISENASEVLKFLVSMYCWCTESNPRDRPSAPKLHEMLANACLRSSLE